MPLEFADVKCKSCIQ